MGRSEASACNANVKSVPNSAWRFIPSYEKHPGQEGHLWQRIQDVELLASGKEDDQRMKGV